MRKQFIVVSIVLLVITPLAWATSNLNLSKSNINRYSLTYPTDLVTAVNAKAMLTAIDRLGPADGAKLKRWLAANFKRYGIDGSRVKKVVILSPSDKVKETAILLLLDPADEAQSIAFTVKSSKSNSSD